MAKGPTDAAGACPDGQPKAARGTESNAGPQAKPKRRAKAAPKKASEGQRAKAKSRRKLVLTDGARLQKASAKGWTRVKEREFLSVLAETCNVKLAAFEAGVSPQHAYARRKTHAAFRSAWIEAISIAYGRLELMLLDRTLNGVEKVIKRRDGSEERMIDYSNQVALTLLKMHRETAIEADHDMPSDEIAELRKKISRKLDRLKQQEEQREADRGGSA